jgi:hypothetical protein
VNEQNSTGSDIVVHLPDIYLERYIYIYAWWNFRMDGVVADGKDLLWTARVRTTTVGPRPVDPCCAL